MTLQPSPQAAPNQSSAKLEMAARLRRGTTLPVKWIAGRVHLGTSRRAKSKLNQWMRNRPEPPWSRPEVGAAVPAEKMEPHAWKTNQPTP